MECPGSAARNAGRKYIPSSQEREVCTLFVSRNDGMEAAAIGAENAAGRKMLPSGSPSKTKYFVSL